MRTAAYGCYTRTMSKARMLRADITEKEHLELRVLAARKQVSGSELVARALRASPVTREAFREETKQ